MPYLAGGAHRSGEHIAPVNNTSPYAGAEGYIHQSAGRPVVRRSSASRAVIILAQGGQVGVVAHPHRHTQRRFPAGGQRHAVEGRQVGRGQQRISCRVNRAGQGDAGAGDRTVAGPFLGRDYERTCGVEQVILAAPGWLATRRCHRMVPCRSTTAARAQVPPQSIASATSTELESGGLESGLKPEVVIVHVGSESPDDNG